MRSLFCGCLCALLVASLGGLGLQAGMKTVPENAYYLSGRLYDEIGSGHDIDPKYSGEVAFLIQNGWIEEQKPPIYAQILAKLRTKFLIEHPGALTSSLVNTMSIREIVETDPKIVKEPTASPAGDIDIHQTVFQPTNVGQIENSALNGIVNFMAHRVKEGMRDMYLDRLKEYLDVDPQKFFFANIREFVASETVFDLSAMKGSLELAAQKDLQRFIPNLKLYLKESSTIPEHDRSALMLFSESFAFADSLLKGIHPAVALCRLDLALKNDTSQTTKDARNLIHLMNLMSINLLTTDIDSTDRWINRKELELLTSKNDKDLRLRIFLGLLCYYDTMGQQITLNGSVKIQLFADSVLKDSKYDSDVIEAETKALLLFANAMERLRAITTQSSQPLNQTSAIQYATAGIDALQALNHLMLIIVSEADVPNSKKLKDFLEVADQKYLPAFQQVVYICDQWIEGQDSANQTSYIAAAVFAAQTAWIFMPADTRNLPQMRRLQQLVQFAAMVTQAHDGSDVEQALNAFAMPEGSWYSKHTKFDRWVMINGYFGIFGGGEYLTPMPKNPKAAWFAGFTAPVGLEVYRWLPRPILISAIDLGTAVSYRITNETEAIPDLTLQNVLAPGLFVRIWGIPKCPFVVSVGAEYAPRLRKVGGELKKNALRGGVSLAMDIPMFTLYSRERP